MTDRLPSAAPLGELPLFAQPKEQETIDNNYKRENLREKTRQWIAENPRVARLFLKFAREMAEKGRRFGIGLITERVRWEARYIYDQEFKCDNDMRAYIARWLVTEDPTLEKYMRFRKVRW